LRADKAALAFFEEDMLVDMFEQVCDVVEPGADNPRKRATHAIRRLREQRMLARVDGAGIVRPGEYALTRLAAAVIEYFLADEALTRESLTLRGRFAHNSQRCWLPPGRWTAKKILSAFRKRGKGGRT
jgi:chromosome partition protein MukF